jgi:hypothetical protein
MGRHTLPLARRGLSVVAIDTSQGALTGLMDIAAKEHLEHLITCRIEDIRWLYWAKETYNVIVACSILDHLHADEARALWPQLVGALAPSGVLMIEVHTTADPGCQKQQCEEGLASASGSANSVCHYFDNGELLGWAMSAPVLRIIRYEERLEWDYTQGQPHKHAKAALLAVGADCQPEFYGFPPQRLEKP